MQAVLVATLYREVEQRKKIEPFIFSKVWVPCLADGGAVPCGWRCTWVCLALTAAGPGRWNHMCRSHACWHLHPSPSLGPCGVP